MYRIYLCYSNGNEGLHPIEFSDKQAANREGEFIKSITINSNIKLVCYFVYAV